MKLEEKDKIIADMKTKHGKVFVSSPKADPDTFVVFKGANRTQTREYKADRDNDAYKYVADERLAQACVVYPDKAGFNAILEEFPFYSGPLAYEIIQASGGGDASSKKA
jgi:hypothetical protein